VSLSNSPPSPRPERKRKKGGPPTSHAAVGEDEGMRTPGSSIPAKDRGVGGRDVTADKVLSAVSLMMKCMAGVLALGDSAMSAAASSPSVLSPNVPGSTDGGLEGCGAKSKGGARVGPPQVSRRSPAVPSPKQGAAAEEMPRGRGGVRPRGSPGNVTGSRCGRQWVYSSNPRPPCAEWARDLSQTAAAGRSTDGGP